MVGESVTWHHRTDTGQRDRYNKPILTDINTTLDDVLVAPNLGDEVTGTAENTSSTRITLYLPAVAGITAADELTIRGTRYKVLADEADWSTGMSDWQPGSVVQVERKEYVDG